MISQQYRDSFQEIDQVAMFRPLTKWSVQVPQAARAGAAHGTTASRQTCAMRTFDRRY